MRPTGAWVSAPWEDSGQRLPLQVFGALALGTTSAFIGSMVVGPGHLHTGIALGVATFFVGLALHSRVYLLIAAIAWLASLGFLRRVVTELEPAGDYDPLLIVGPAALLALAVVAWDAGALQDRGALANAVLIFSVVAVASALNPSQESLESGAAGLLFILVPTLAFWIGRSLSRSAVRAALVLVAALAIPAAAYGLVQTFDSFPSWDERWAESSDYAALYVDGVLRPFSSFSGAAEYSFFLGCGVVVWIALGRRWSRLPLAVAAVALLATGVWFVGSRTVVITVLGALALMLAARRGWPLGRAVVVVAVAALSLPALVGAIAPASTGSDSAAALAEHQISGITDPLDPDESTLIVHANLIKDGVLSAFTTPFGHGSSSVTIAADKFGGATRNTEGDPSNAAVALGLPGLLAFAVIFLLGFRTVYRLASIRRDAIALAGLGILAVTALQWLNGGQYAVAFLPWLMMGWADRALHEEPA